LTAFGPDQLLRNDSNGDAIRFTDVTAAAGVVNGEWSTSCTFADLDRDGWLDLFVVNYLEYSLATHVECRSPTRGLLGYCSPDAYPPIANRLFRNLGAGRFDDVSGRAGISSVLGKGLGTAAGDFDGDGDPDLFVANDQAPGSLFINQGDGQFVESALLLGCALNAEGKATAGMGVAPGDVDGDGWEDILITNFSGETNTLYRNLDGDGFEDRTAGSGLGPSSFNRLGFGAGWIDADLDADMDLFIANGHISDIVELEVEAPGVTYAQPCQLYLNDGRGRFGSAGDAAGPVFDRRLVGRAAAFGDIDNDGDTDILVTANGGAPLLLRNDSRAAGRLVLELIGRRSNRDAIGARVELTAAGRRQVRELRSGYSYLAINDRRLVFGLGDALQADRILIRWPSGAQQEFGPWARGQRVRVVEGQPPALEPLAPIGP
jgi:hypothetical protein